MYYDDSMGIHGNMTNLLLAVQEEKAKQQSKPKKKKAKKTKPARPKQSQTQVVAGLDELGPVGSVHNPARWRWPGTDTF